MDDEEIRSVGGLPAGTRSLFITKATLFNSLGNASLITFLRKMNHAEPASLLTLPVCPRARPKHVTLKVCEMAP